MQYMGGKTTIARHILSVMLRNKSEWYVEPFVGGANVIDKVRSRKRLANDVNYYLIEFWKALAGGWTPEVIEKSFYDDVRENKDKYPPHVVGWVGVGCSFRGKFFGGYVGYDEKKGRHRQVESIGVALVQARSLKGTVFTCGPFSDMDIPENAIVYCDPPYEGTTGYKFEFDHQKFWDWVRGISSEKRLVFVSEYKAPEDFVCVWSLTRKKATMSYDRANGENISMISTERLFIHESAKASLPGRQLGFSIGGGE